MAMDRDLGVAFVRAWFEAGSSPVRGWEMTAATGVRGLRLLEEGGVFGEFTFTEENREALSVLRANGGERPGARVVATDARQGVAGAPFDFVDLDPYGSPARFVPAALESVRPGGVLAVTATDLMVLAGAQPSACERRYGSRPVRGRLGPEGGLRILLAYVASEAERRGRSVRSLLGYVRDHHVRAYLEVGKYAGDPAPVGSVDPATWTGPDVGDRGPYGPLWLGALFDRALARKLRVPSSAAAPDELGRFLARVNEEVEVDVPFYYEANRLSHALGLPRPPSLDRLLAHLRARGFRAGRTHVRPEGFRTDAPRPVVERSVADLSSVH